jgi:hypothetical protein
VDEVRPGPSRVELVLVSVLNRLEGRFPRSSGTRTGYILKAAASDLTGGADFTREMSLDTETSGTIALTIAASATEVSYAYTPAGTPGLIRWADGAWTVKVDVSVANTNIYLGVRLVRTNASGTLQERRPDRSAIAAAEEQQCTAGVKTFTFADIGWTEGASAGTDRLRVEYHFRNAAGTSQNVTIATGTTNTEVIPPWVQTTDLSPVTFDAVYPGTAYTTWRDSAIGLPARYRGAVPDTNRWRISKAVLDADGRRELERLAWLDGCAVIGSQGRVKAVNLWGPRQAVVATVSAETGLVEVDQGFSDRLPEYTCAYGYDLIYPRQFAGEVRAQHSASYAAFGPSRLGPKDPRVEDETARYVTTAAHAGEIARGVVVSMGAGFLRVLMQPTDWLPHVELGDDVAVETDQFLLRDPTSGAAIKGWAWVLGTVIRARGWNRAGGLTVWVRGLVDVYALGQTVQRRVPYEGPVVLADLRQDPALLGTVRIVARCASQAATIYYVEHADGVAPPSRERLDEWTAYTSVLSLSRDASVYKQVSFFARDGGFTGPIATYRIAPDATAQVLSLSATQSGTSPNITVTFSAVADSDTRRVRFYWRKDTAGTAWPTVDGTQSAEVSEDYLVKDVSVEPNGGGSYGDGGPAAGGDLTTDGDAGSGGADLCADTNYVQCIAQPVDWNGNVGTRREVSYDVAASAGAALTATSWTLDTDGTSCSNKRRYDLAWTPNGSVADGTHDLYVYATVNGIRSLILTETSPATTTSANAVAINAYAHTSGSTVSVAFDYELKAGSTVVDSGIFGYFKANFTGFDCSGA